VRYWLTLALLLPLCAWAQTSKPDAANDDSRPKAEVEAKLPSFPKPEDYLPFTVNAIAGFDFFIDAKSISVGTDGVVRYSLIAKSSGGAVNISYEGLRCFGRQFRVYAFGRPDGTWSRARDARWQTISLADGGNMQRAVLHADFFCPALGIIASPDEGVQALKGGRNPRANTSGGA
jgi:hypothetical protein